MEHFDLDIWLAEKDYLEAATATDMAILDLTTIEED